MSTLGDGDAGDQPSRRLGDLRAQLYPGDGLAARFKSALLLVLPAERRQQAFVDDLLSVVRGVTEQPQSPPGRRLARRLAGLLALTDPEDVPAFCVLADVDNGLAVILHGPLDLEVTGPRSLQRMTGRGLATWLDRMITSEFDRLTVLPSGLTDVAPDPRSSLERGVVRAVGVVLSGEATSAPSPAPALEQPAAPSFAAVRPPDTPDEPITQSPLPLEPAAQKPHPDVAGFEAVSLLDAAPSRERAPLVVESSEEHELDLKVSACAKGHPNEGEAAYCTECGLPLPGRGKQPRRASVPGWLVVEGGAMYLLDNDYVIGRSPQQDAEVVAGRVRPLSLRDPEQTVSRVHARVFVQGGQVTVVDAQSANGTYVGVGGEEDWTRLAEGQRWLVGPGTRLLIGDCTLRFELERSDSSQAEEPQ